MVAIDIPFFLSCPANPTIVGPPYPSHSSGRQVQSMWVLLSRFPVCLGALGLFSLVFLASETGAATLTTPTRPVLGQHDNDNDQNLPSSGGVLLQRDVGMSNSTARIPAEGYDRDTYQWKHQCPQTRDLIPATNNRLEQMMWRLRSDAYRQDSAIRMSKAIRVNTTVTDSLRHVDSRKRAWDFMDEFAHLLRHEFPRARHHLQIDKIAKHGLVYTWRGSNPNLKPTVLVAHQDVVAVNEEDLGAWKYPPFDGYWDGKYVWGRGATDCKNTLIASLEAVEELVKAGFKPKRTVILANGFDEEIDGHQGAGNIVQFLLDEYGYGGIAAVVDEGPGIMRAWVCMSTVVPHSLLILNDSLANISLAVWQRPGSIPRCGRKRLLRRRNHRADAIRTLVHAAPRQQHHSAV